jgi:phosphatidylserine/phosphatidylglycerophosphate/cardiolipin synthase-like enzyme
MAGFRPSSELEMPTTRVEYALIEASMLPVDIVNAVVRRIEALPATATREQTLEISNCISQGHSGRAALTLLLEAWHTERASVSASALCFALRAAASAAAAAMQSQRCELAWSGPEPANSPFRRTDRASADVIDSAFRELWVATYSISRTDLMVTRLQEASRRGVEVHLLVEHPDRMMGERDGTSAYRDLGITPMTWRRDMRPPNSHASFHPKCIIADAQVALVTSANLSAAAHDRNIEAGVLITGGNIPRQLAERFASMLTHGMLEAI